MSITTKIKDLYFMVFEMVVMVILMICAGGMCISMIVSIISAMITGVIVPIPKWFFDLGGALMGFVICYSVISMFAYVLFLIFIVIETTLRELLPIIKGEDTEK